MKIGRKLCSYRKYQKIEPNNYQKSVSLDNPLQNIWNKARKSSKTGQDWKRLISPFARLLIYFSNIFLLHFLTLNIKFFSNLWGDSYKMFVVLDAKFQFVCDKLDLYKSIEKSQNIITTTVASAAKFPCFPCVLSPNFLIFRDKEKDDEE